MRQLNTEALSSLTQGTSEKWTLKQVQFDGDKYGPIKSASCTPTPVSSGTAARNSQE